MPYVCVHFDRILISFNSEIMNTYVSNQQQDAHEFLVNLLATMELDNR